LKLKALFAIRDVQTGKILSLPVFEKKDLAKNHRRSLNKVNKEGKEVFDYVVTYGQDHDKFEPETAKFKEVKVEAETQTVHKNTEEVEAVAVAG
jgi:hypothetical protein